MDRNDDHEWGDEWLDDAEELETLADLRPRPDEEDPEED